MTAQDNIELARKGYEAFSKGDMETIDKLWDDDIRWHVSGRSRISGNYTGKQEVFGFFGKIMELTDNTFTVEVHDFLASEDHVVALVNESATRGGKSLDAREAHVIHIKDGKMTEFWGCPEDAYKTDEFFS